jgi:NADH-quinone oxidoreductase subunit H
MISYELVIGLILLNTVILSNSLNLTTIVLCQQHVWYLIPCFPAFIMFLVAALAETSRAPFDLTEGESELVGGFQTEYAGLSFSYFALAEYGHIVSMSAVICVFFLGGWLLVLTSVTFYYVFALKLLVVMF